MKEFKEYFPIEELEKIIHSKNKYEQPSSLHEALDKFLTENQLLKPFTNHKTHRTNFGYYWESYLNNNNKMEDYQKERVLSGIIDKFLFMRVFYEEDIQKAYEILNTKINQGNFQPFDLMDSLYDFESGEDFKLVLKNWEPSLVRYIPGKTLQERARFELAPEEEVKKVLEAQIYFKTGHLIVADWFKIDEFTQKVDQDKYSFDVNSAKGRVQQAQYYLDNFNFIHTSAWSDSYGYQKDGLFVFTSYDEDFNPPKGFQELGRVDKELRAISIIEKEQLIKLVGSEKKVDDYLKEYSNCILELQVTPGTYTFTLSSSPELIKEEMAKIESVQLEENQKEVQKLLKKKHFQPNLIMQKLDIKLQNKLKIK